MKSVFFTTGIREGDARAPGALAKLLKAKKLPVTFACAEQVHDVRVVIVPKLRTSKKFAYADGLLTQASDQPLAIFTADCIPLFVSADNGQGVGLLHAGWRGVRGKILTQAVRLLVRRWRIQAPRVRVWMGPAIGPCCFEVRWDVARHFPQARVRFRDRWKVDLEAALRAEAKTLGVRWKGEKASQGCTMHGSGRHSYRRDKTDKRQVSVIMKKI